jgi:NNP family nitrate/nitrite transporter-like MFS transporter
MGLDGATIVGALSPDSPVQEEQKPESAPAVPEPAKADLSQNPAKSKQLSQWLPEDEEFWSKWGNAIAWKNLLVSIPNLLLMFASWTMWSIVVVTIQSAHDNDIKAYSFGGIGEIDGGETQAKADLRYRALLFMIPSLAGLAGATMRVVNSFMITAIGGATCNSMNSTMAIIPMIGIGIFAANSDVPFSILVVLAAMSGIGGGAFASSMPNCSFLFPKKKQGMALGLNACIGNLGVSLTQLVLPQICGVAMFGGSAIGGKYVFNAGWFYVILLVLAATPAWLIMNNMPSHGSANTMVNVVAYCRIQLPACIGAGLGIVLFILLNGPMGKSPVLIIIRIFALAFICCVSTGVGLWFLSAPAVKEKLRKQAGIFYDKHTWLFTWLYIMTFGSFIGFSNVFPKLIKDVFGYLPDGTKNPNAPSVAAFSWMGACVGSLARVAGGWLSDKYGGGAVTHWGTIVQVVATIVTGIFIRLAMASETPEKWFAPYLIMFLILFCATGSSNGSTFRQMSVCFPPEIAAPVLGWTSAVAAYGAAIFPACFGAGLKGNFVDIVMYVFAFYYITCLFVNWWFYYRKGCEKPC